ncbi:EKC/KEOPS complex subunit TP53RK-like [Lineus longissimus]|uniref:EKC/KEOPS complex subunit TP53RK-like n=1 Tax=Lineus longissimus TaxID=88925 RepID=UPI002B4CD796
MANDANNVLLKQGAEGRIFKSELYGLPCIIKERFPKTYRHPALDKSLTAQRTKSEVRCIMRCRANGIRTPVVYFVDLETNKIYMEFIEESITVRDQIVSIQKLHPETYVEKLKTLAEKIGAIVGKMHEKNIIHGDMTTSNMLLKTAVNLQNLELIMIDFGLSYIENVAEDKGVDLYVLERAFLSTHPNTEKLFNHVLKSYVKHSKGGAVEVMKKLDEVRLRGRKRTMVG